MTVFIGDQLGQWRLWGVWFGTWFIGISKAIYRADGTPWQAKP